MLWRSKLAMAPKLTEETLVGEAIAQAGCEDFGAAWFRGPLRALLQSLNEEAALNPVGRVVAHIHCRKLLRERLWATRWFQDFPEIRRHPIAAPVVVVGPMRSGTTRLHRLLAADQRFSHLRMFETVSPVPEPGRANGHDPRPRTAAKYLGLLHRANPTTAIIHPTGPHEPEEELGLLVASAWGMKHEAQWRIPGYARFCEQEDASPAYAHMADLLRLTAWLRGQDPARPWLLKTPQHMLDLPALLRVFPDARILFIHRDPATVVGSSCSMVWNQMRLQTDHADATWIGREWLRKTRLKVDRMAAARGQLAPGRMLDVHYDAMDRDWRREMRRIYDFLGLDIGPAEPAMARYVARCERNPLQAHAYRLADFGLRAEAVREIFSDYIEELSIPTNGTRGNGSPHPG